MCLALIPHVSLITFAALTCESEVQWKRPKDFIKFWRSPEWAALKFLGRGAEKKLTEGEVKKFQVGLQLTVKKSALWLLCCPGFVFNSPWDIFIVQSNLLKEVNCTRFFLRMYRSQSLKLRSRSLCSLFFLPALRNALEQSCASLLPASRWGPCIFSSLQLSTNSSTARTALL